MEDDFLKSIFLRAREQYDGAARWTFIILLVLLLFHLMTFSRFINLTNDLSRAEADIGRFAVAERSVVALNDSIERLEGSALDPLDSRVELLLENLISDFTALDQAVAQVSTPTTAEFTAFDPNIPAPRESMMVQSQVQAPEDLFSNRLTRESFDLDERLQQKIRDAENAEELRSVLLPTIVEKIIQPRINELNVYWQEEVLPDFQRDSNAVIDDLEESRILFPEGKELWDDLRDDIELATRVVASLEFQPPSDDPEWWSSVSGKLASLADLENAAGDQLSGALESSKAIDRLLGEVRSALEQNERLQAKLNEELRRVQESFDQQQSKLASLGRPFEIVSLDLDFVVKLYPLLLGIGLAATSFWQAHRLRELTWVANSIHRRSGESLPLEWLFTRTMISLPETQQLDSPRGPRWRLWAEPRRLNLGILGGAIIYFAWIGLAGWQLVRLGDVTTVSATVLAAGGALAVALSQIYRWNAIRQVRDLRNTLSQAPESEI